MRDGGDDLNEFNDNFERALLTILSGIRAFIKGRRVGKHAAITPMLASIYPQTMTLVSSPNGFVTLSAHGYFTNTCQEEELRATS